MEKIEKYEPRVISIHALREEGDLAEFRARVERTISIHALREEGDPPAGFRRAGDHDFYPRPPRGGRRWGSGSV